MGYSHCNLIAGNYEKINEKVWSLKNSPYICNRFEQVAYLINLP